MWVYVAGVLMTVCGFAVLAAGSWATRRAVQRYFELSTERVDELGKALGALKIDYENVAQLDDRLRKLEQQLLGFGRL